MDGAAVRGDAAPVEAAHSAGAGADGDAFAALYERYGQRAFNLAYRICGSESDAAAAVHEAFLGVLREPGGEPDSALPLLAATRNACHGAMGTGQGERIPNLAAPLGGGDGGLPGHEEIRDASLRLPERQREALALRELEELSYDEIAAIMEISPHAVAELISRARINLCGELGGTALASAAVPSPECERAQPLIAAREDGQLDTASPEAAWLDAHLAGCGRCMLALDAMREAHASYRAWTPGGDGSDRPSKPRRRRAGLAVGLAALLLFAGLAAALARNEPPAAPADPAASASPEPRVGAPKSVKEKGAPKTRAKAPVAAAPVANSSPVPIESSASSEPASGHLSHPSREMAIQPTQQTAAAKPKTKPTPVPAATSPPAPEPAAEEPAPAAGPAAKPSHGHEPPGKPADRPPR